MVFKFQGVSPKRRLARSFFGPEIKLSRNDTNSVCECMGCHDSIAVQIILMSLLMCGVDPACVRCGRAQAQPLLSRCSAAAHWSVVKAYRCVLVSCVCSSKYACIAVCANLHYPRLLLVTVWCVCRQEPERRLPGGHGQRGARSHQLHHVPYDVWRETERYRPRGRHQERIQLLRQGKLRWLQLPDDCCHASRDTSNELVQYLVTSVKWCGRIYKSSDVYIVKQFNRCMSYDIHCSGFKFTLVEPKLQSVSQSVWHFAPTAFNERFELLVTMATLVQCLFTYRLHTRGPLAGTADHDGWPLYRRPS